MSKLVAGVLALVLLGGCLSCREATRGFLGISTRELERLKPFGLSRQYGLGDAASRQAVEKALSGMGAYVYSRDGKKRLIAVYVSEQDTTPVGIFFEPAQDDGTRVTVSSPSTFAKELVSAAVFAGLDRAMQQPDEDQAPAGPRETPVPAR